MTIRSLPIRDLICDFSRRARTAAGLVLLCGASIGLAQNSTPNVPPASQPLPASQPAPAAEPLMVGLPAGTVVRNQMAAEPGPFITLEDKREWLTRVSINISGKNAGLIRHNPAAVGVADYRTAFQTMSLYFPIVGSSANSTFGRVESSMIRIGNDASYPTAEYKDDQVVSKIARSGFTTLKEVKPGVPLPSGAWLTRWEFPDASATNEVNFEIRYTSSSSNTKFDWDAASKIGWPTQGWPLQAAAALQSQVYVDYMPDPKTGQPVVFDFTQMRKVVEKVTKGNPRALPPAVLARALAAEIIPRFSLSGDTTKRGSEGPTQIAGLNIQRVDETFRLRRGSEVDLALLMVAIYRDAGLPARVVIGMQAKTDPRDRPRRHKDEDRVRAWLEFCIYDEARNTVTWVPVDAYRMRDAGTGVPQAGRRWMYFGDHDEMRLLVPMAFNLLPPSVNAVAYGDPAMWGWTIAPTPPAAAYTRMSLDSEEAPRRSKDVKKR